LRPGSFTCFNYGVYYTTAVLAFSSRIESNHGLEKVSLLSNFYGASQGVDHHIEEKT
jgi:hypothetical protein